MRVAARTIAAVPCSIVWVPRNPFRSVAVYPGSTTLTRNRGNALAYCTVSMLTAAFEAV